MYNLKEIKKTCDLFFKAYQSYDDFIPDWLDSKPPLRKTVRAILSKADTVDLPEDFWKAQASLYIDAHMLTDPKSIRKMLKEVEPFASEDTRKALAFWADNPGFWCFYAIKETLGDDFFIIEDLVTGQTHLLHSSDIGYMQTDVAYRNKHYLSLMLFNGSCLQAIGFPKFNSLPASDLQFFLSLFSPGLALSPAINRNFIRLLDLESISSLPVFVEGDVALKQTWQSFRLKDFSIFDLEGTWDSQEKGRLQIYRFVQEAASYASLPNFSVLEAERGILTATLVRDNKSGEMALFTSTDTSYALFALLLNRSYPELDLPEKPSVSISLGLSLLLSEGTYPLPWNKFKGLLDAQDEYDDNPIPVPELTPERLQELLDLSGDDNHIDIRDVLSRPTAQKQAYQDTYQVDPNDKGFEMFDWPVPPQGIQDLFDSTLNDSVVFEVMEDKRSLDLFNTLTNGSYANLIEQDGLASFITSLFADAYPEKVSMFLMNAFLWSLYYKGSSWVPARSYALEILKMKSYPLTPIYFEREAFLQDFTSFIKRILCTRGLCSLAKRPSPEEVRLGTFTIKGSDAFYSLVRPGEYRSY